MSLQDVLDAMGEAAQTERANYHLTLGELINALETADDKSKPVVFSNGGSPRNPHSYRGYYEDLGIDATSETERSAAEVLELLYEVHETNLTGYKGGQFFMGDNTALWQAEYGSSSNRLAIMGVTENEDEIVLDCQEK